MREPPSRFPEAPQASSPRTFDLVPLIAIGLCALAARAIHLEVAEAQSLFGGLFLDSLWYAEQAAAIRLGHGVGDRPYLLSPLYPYMLALLTDASGTLDADRVRWMQAVVGALTAVLTAVLAAWIGGRTAGWIAGLAAALYAPALHIGALLLVSALQSFFLVLAVVLLVLDDAREGPRTSRLWLGAGVAFGVAAALHPSGLAVAFACLGALAIKTWRTRATAGARKACAPRAIAILAGLALVIAPFTLRNLVAGGEPILLSANGGFNFWIGNEAHATGLFRTPSGYDLANDPVGRGLAERAVRRQLTFGEASAWWRDRALADVRADPLRALALLSRKLLLFFHPREIPQLGESFRWFRARAWTLRFPLDAFAVLMLALAAPFAAALRHGRAGLARLCWPLVVLLAYAATIALFFVTGRYRAPVMPVAIALAAVGIVNLHALFFDPATRRRRAAAVLAGALALAWIGSRGLYTWPGAPLWISESSAVEERHQGMSLYQQGRFAEAVEVYGRALASEDDAATRTNLANALKALGRTSEAAEHYRRVLAAEPDDGIAWYNYGNLLRLDIKDLRGAQEAYRRATELRPQMAEAHFNLGAVLIDLAQYADAAVAIESALGLAAPTVPWRKDAENALLRAHAAAFERTGDLPESKP